jgi:gas vesicle protein
MSDDKNRDEKNRMDEKMRMGEEFRKDVASTHDHESKHPFALGVLAGAAVGAGVALLCAPRTGAQMRHDLGDQLTRAKGSCSTGYKKAKGTASHWAEKVADGARETGHYVREVSDAVRRKAHTEAQAFKEPHKEPRTTVKVDYAGISR